MKRQNWRKGFLIFSFLLFPITQFYFSPYLILMGISEGVLAGSFFMFSALFVGGMVFGRAFCGWLMPCGGLQEICFMAQAKPVKRKRLFWIKYAIWIPWMGAIILSMIRFSGAFRSDPLYHTDHGISISQPWMYVIYYGVILIFITLSLIVGKRAGCHAACWIAPFMIFGRKTGRLLKFPSLKIKAHPDRCVQCGLCNQHCPMSLDVQTLARAEVFNHEDCLLCGACVDSCPRKVLEFRFGRR